MEDFTEFAEARKAAKHQTIQSSATEQTGFIASRLNRDNFWNLMFLALPSLIIFIFQLLEDVVPLGFVLALGAVIFTPYLVSKLNAVEYKDNMFHSSSTNRSLGTHAPKNLGLILWLGIPFSVFWIFFIHSKMPQLDENLAVYNAIFWLVPTLYFILRNLPISMVFNKTTWIIGDGSKRSYSSGRRSSTFNSRRTSMSYDYLSNNIWHRSYLDRHRR